MNEEEIEFDEAMDQLEALLWEREDTACIVVSLVNGRVDIHATVGNRLVASEVIGRLIGVRH